jgi:hypothetical protein
MKTSIVLGSSALALAAVLTFAQETPPDRPGQGRPPGQGGPGRFVMPLMAALDANSDGTIDATEIANASAALKKLDKNSDGKLTADELRPSRPEGGRRGPGGERPSPPAKP